MRGDDRHGLTDPDANKYAQHSMVLVPVDTDGVVVERMLDTMGFFDEPFGHGEVSFTDVRVPVTNIIAGPGRAVRIAQGRLGPGRVHHAMRMVGMAERALHLACERGLSRIAFGKPIINLGGNRERVAEARIAIRCDTAAHPGCGVETRHSRAARRAQRRSVPSRWPLRTWPTVIDFAMQIHGGAGLSSDSHSRAPGRPPVPCAWPTVPTKSTRTSSPGSNRQTRRAPMTAHDATAAAVE